MQLILFDDEWFQLSEYDLRAVGRQEQIRRICAECTVSFTDLFNLRDVAWTVLMVEYLTHDLDKIILPDLGENFCRV